MKTKRSYLRNTDKTAKLTLVCSEQNIKRVKEIMRKRKGSVSGLVNRIMESIISADYQGRLHPGIEGLKGQIKGKPPKAGIGR